MESISTNLKVVKLFEEKKVCTHWNAEREVWYFSGGNKIYKLCQIN